MSDSARTLGELLLDSCRRWPDRTAVMVHDKSGWNSTTYKQHLANVERYASALQALGLKRGDRLVLLGENSYEWALADWAAQTLGVVTVPIYPTLPPDQAQYIATDCGAQVALVGSAALAERLKGMPDIRILGLKPLEGLDSLDAHMGGMDHDAWTEGMKAIHPDDLATIIYTSGTTGNPKGAMLPHRAFTSLCHGIRSSLPVDENDLFLSFLPLSHVYERFAGHVLPISCGAAIAYARSITTLASDMETVKPTIMLCVPRFLESIRSRVIDSTAKQPPLKRKLFEWAMAQGIKRRNGGFAPFAGILDAIVGKKIREKMGGRLRFFVSGGAALPRHVADFYGAFNIKVLQGYGLTETCAASAFNHPDDDNPDTVGEPIEGVEFTFAPDGEILISGPSVMLGYYNLPEASAEAIDKDGWFHTGDIGEWVGKKVKITDRKKDLLVLGNGKNVAPQLIENKLRESSYIGEAVLFGDGMEYVCALIVPDFEHLKRFAKEKGIEFKDEAELVQNEQVRKLIKDEIDAVNKTMADFERVKRHDLLSKPFSIESGELTPSMKVKRKVVKEKYAAQIEGLKR
ncbi:MAG: AMP-dependent synthetase/ligase [Fimbriimonadaceae bacterium]|nr:AMP-dependent synthetase/ligase [Fimbriimonadaceae bacterium]